MVKKGGKIRESGQKWAKHSTNERKVQIMDKMILRMFEMFYPATYNRAVSFEESGPNSVIAILEDGTRSEYNNLLRTIRNVIPYDGAEESWKREFSHRLVEKMMERGFDQTSLEEASGLSHQSISCYIHRKKIPTGFAIDKLARALNCRPSDLTDF